MKRPLGRKPDVWMHPPYRFARIGNQNCGLIAALLQCGFRSRGGSTPADIMVTGDLPSTAAAAPASASVRSAETATLTALVARIAAGDQGALAELYDCTATKLLGFALLMVKDQQDAEEVTCDVYLQVWRSSLRYDPARGSVLAWMLGICRARAIDRFRRRRARSPAEGVVGESGPGGAAADGEPCDLLQRLEQGSAIRRALERLSPVRRQLLALAFFQGLSHEEISVKTNLPVGTVKSHIRRALATLRAQLGPGDGDASAPV